jgi:plastocyanin
MKRQSGIIIALAMSLSACQSMGLGGGDGMPTITRTGEVKDIVIRENVEPATVTANPGDEIRWINKRQGDARVIFLLPVEGQLTCQRGFGGMMSGGNKNQYTAKLGVNDTASVCFKSPTEIKYVVRADSNLPSGEENIAGTINVGGGEDQSSNASIDRKKGKVTQVDPDEVQ